MRSSTRALAGLLPRRSSLLLTGECAALALVGAARLAGDRRPPARALALFAAACAALVFALFSAYFLSDVRFLAPLAPLAALCAGLGATTGLDWLREAAGRHQRPAPFLARLVGGTAVAGLTLLGGAHALGPALEQCYLYQRYARGDSYLYQFPADLRAIEAYRAVAAAGGVLVTDVALPLLGEARLHERHPIVPLTAGEYWGQAPLRDRTEIVARRQFLDDALRRGVPVYTDSYTVDTARRRGPADFERFLALHRVRLEPLAGQGPLVIYRLAPAP